MSRPGTAFGWLLAGLLGLCAVLAGPHLVQIPLRIPLNYNEGWMAFYAMRAVHGGVMYPPPGAFTTNNYPPLSFYLTGAAGVVIGDAVVAGRLIAFAALCLAAGGIGVCARRLGAGWPAAATGAALFALFNLTFFHTYVAMADPQWLGQAVMLCGLPLLLQAEEGPLPPARAALSALLMVAGGFVKHNLFALPLAAGLWLLLYDRRALLAWGAAAAAALAAGGLAVWRLYGAAPFGDILGNHRRLLVDQWPDAVVYLTPMLPMIAATVWLARHRRGERRVKLAVLFVAVALPLSLIQRLGEGVNVNAYFEVLVALCIAAAAAVDAAPPRPSGKAWSRAGTALALAAPMLLGAPYFLWEGARDFVRIPSQQAAWSREIAAVSAAPGPAACEMLSICYWAGKGFELDFFNYGQDLRAGASPTLLEGLIDGRRFGAIELTRDEDYRRGRGRLPAPIPAHIEAAYAVAAPGPGASVVMLPRPRR